METDQYQVLDLTAFTVIRSDKVSVQNTLSNFQIPLDLLDDSSAALVLLQVRGIHLDLITEYSVSPFELVNFFMTSCSCFLKSRTSIFWVFASRIRS